MPDSAARGPSVLFRVGECGPSMALHPWPSCVVWVLIAVRITTGTGTEGGARWPARCWKRGVLSYPRNYRRSPGVCRQAKANQFFTP